MVKWWLAGDITSLESGAYLKYYKKGNDECGTPDNLLTSNKRILNDSHIVTYPNPVVNKMSIVGLEQERFVLAIFDLQGALMYVDESNSSVLDLSDLKTGTYVLELSLENGLMRKLISVNSGL